MTKEITMTGCEARDFIVNRLPTTQTGPKFTRMKLSIHLAYDFLKLTPNEIGHFADEMLRDGLAALTRGKLYGYKVEIDHSQQGHFVEFCY